MKRCHPVAGMPAVVRVGEALAAGSALAFSAIKNIFLFFIIFFF